MAWTGVVTDCGNDMLARWTVGKRLTVTRAAAGSGCVEELAAKRSLFDEKQAASILENKAIESGQKLKIQLTPPEKGYRLNQIGVWARLEDDEEKLITLFQNEDGIYIPSREESPDFVYTFYGVLMFSNMGGELTVNIDTSALVSLGQLESKLNEIIKDTAGKPNGTVILDQYGKIPSELLPEISSVRTLEITIPKNAWEADGDAFSAEIAIDGVTEDDYPQLTLHREFLNIAAEAGMETITETTSGAIKLTSISVPSGDMSAVLALFGSVGNQTGGNQSGEYITELPVATGTKLGGVIVEEGSGLKIDKYGRISVDTASDREISDAIEDAFKTEEKPDEKPDEDIPTDEIATDEEVSDMITDIFGR